MKKLGINLVALAILCFALTGLSSAKALAEDTKYHQTANFTEDVMVGNTTLKKGRYRITFHTDTGEVKFAEENGDTVLTAKATVESMNKDADNDETQTTATDKGQMLTKLVFAGHAKYAVLTAETATIKGT